MIKTTKVKFRIGDDLVEHSGGRMKRLKDIKYIIDENEWFYILVDYNKQSRRYEYKNNTKIKLKTNRAEDLYNIKERVCPECGKKGKRKKFDFYCDNNRCDINTYEGMNYQFSTNKVSTKPINDVDKISGYSVRNNCWYHK